MIAIVIAGNPTGKGRARSTKAGHHYTPAATVAWERIAGTAATLAMQGRPPLAGPVRLHVVAWMPVPPSWSKRKQAQALAGELLPTTKPDADNIAKIVGDAFNGIVWVDDAQVVELVLRKLYGPSPEVSVHVSPIQKNNPLDA